jgi:hypothetical protein
MRANLRVAALRRVWPVLDGDPTGPWWEMTFYQERNPSSRAHS